uniref:I1_Vc11.5 prepropeptide n=1 Tax=Conus victoriae TaxID=319920 RepID=W4VS13_CONVC
MKLRVTFLLVLVILPSVTGEKSSERTLSGAALRSDRRTCSNKGEQCEDDSDCCWHLCCVDNKCAKLILLCNL